jgi:hypothetical protein
VLVAVLASSMLIPEELVYVVLAATAGPAVSAVSVVSPAREEREQQCCR